MIGIHLVSTFSPFLFMTVLDHLIGGEVSWYMLFVHDVIVVDETKVGVMEVQVGIMRT